MQRVKPIIAAVEPTRSLHIRMDQDPGDVGWRDVGRSLDHTYWNPWLVWRGSKSEAPGPALTTSST